MKKDNKDTPLNNSDETNQKPETPLKTNKQGGANPTFPQEYEEQVGMDIRMKPQPYVKPEKRED